MLKRILVLSILSIFLFSCGSSKKVKTTKTRNAEASSIIEKHYDSEADFKTVSGRLRAVYQDDEKTQSVTLSIRMEKDKAIWMSASILGFPVAKAYITPQRASYYEKVTQSYFDGDFSVLSDFLGTPLDFEKLQNLLIGQTIYDLQDDDYDFENNARGFQFTSPAGEMITKMFLLNSTNLRAAAQQIAQESENRSLTVTYSDYQNVDGIVFPENIKIIASEGGTNTNIDLTYRSLSFGEELSFPFDIPSGYDEISLK